MARRNDFGAQRLPLRRLTRSMYPLFATTGRRAQRGPEPSHDGFSNRHSGD
jgi:hypothetical protein